jgi:hypothetical protein
MTDQQTRMLEVTTLQVADALPDGDLLVWDPEHGPNRAAKWAFVLTRDGAVQTVDWHYARVHGAGA